ncbi:MAG: ankyrin-3 [Rickettsiaceae bacterium]|jgi:ankyrin repeat protein|nr:ankyrin-3 [Rickettsiaceae bacterium]
MNESAMDELLFYSQNETIDLIEKSRSGDLKSVIDLLDSGVDVNLKAESGNTALHVASQEGHTKIVHTLVERGADVNSLTVDGWTALHFAAQRGYVDVVNFLIESGIDINVAGLRYQRTALHYAASHGRTEVVAALIAAGAKTDLKDKIGDTAFSIANKKSYNEISNLLTKK